MRDLSELAINLSQSQLQPVAKGIAVVEEMVGARLPEEYVTFLLFCNGGQPQLNTFYSEFEGNEQSWTILNFFHLSDTEDDENSILWQYQQRWSAAPRELLPIAQSKDGYSFLLDLSETGSGKVVYWTGDIDPDFALTTVADSFEQLIDGLTKNRLEEV